MEMRKVEHLMIKLTFEEAGEILSYLDHLEDPVFFGSKAVNDFYEKLCRYFKTGEVG